MNKFLSRKLNKKGFTLVELIVVICITGIFLGMVMTMLISSYRTYGSSKAQLKKNTEITMIESYFDRIVNIANSDASLKITLTYTEGESPSINGLKIDSDNNQGNGYEYSLTFDGVTLCYVDSSLDIDYSYSKTLFSVTYSDNILKLQFYYLDDGGNKQNTQCKLYSIIGGIN